MAARLAIPVHPRRLRLLQGLSTASLLALFGASLLHVAARTYNPFIYFRF
jgi:hypothetical protein